MTTTPTEPDLRPVTLEEFKRHLNLSSSTSESDVELNLHLDAAIRAIEKRIGPLVHTEFTERLAANSNGRLVLNNTPVVSITTLTHTNGLTRAVDTLSIDGTAGIVSGVSGWRIAAGEYDAVYVAGHGTTASADHKLAVLYVGEHLWEMQQQTGIGSRPGLWGEDAPGGEESAHYIYRGFALPRRALELISGDEQLGFA